MAGIQSERSSDGLLATNHFGWVRLTRPTRELADPRIESHRVETLGIAVQDGLSVGWTERDTLSVGTGCNAVIVVRTSEQFRDLTRLIEKLGGDGLCATRSLDP
jgi:hypothetical protein